MLTRLVAPKMAVGIPPTGPRAHWKNDMGTTQNTTTAILTPLTPRATDRLDYDLRRAVPAPPPIHARNTLMIVGSDAKHSSYDDVCLVPVPESTFHPKTGNKVYAAVHYSTIMDGLRDHVSHLLGSDPVYETYTLSGGSNPGSQLYGRIAWDSGVPGMMIEVILRSSYDKTLRIEWGIGQGTSVCANGMFNAAQILGVKHTHNVLDRFRASLVDGSVGVTQRIEDARKRIEWVDGLKQIPMSSDLFNAFVGVLQGRPIINEGKETSKMMLTAHRASAARRYWNACHTGDLHAEHGQNDLFSGYQALTGANHLSTTRSAMTDAAGVDFMVEQVEKSGGCLTGIPAFNFEVEEYDA